MCLSPIRIKNPNKGLHYIRGDPRYLKDRQSGYLNIPCGHCSECIAKRQLDLVQRALMESMVNEVFFCTFTYNNETLPLIEVNDYDIAYADHEDVIHMFKRIKKYKLLYPFRYFGVSELGSKRGRPHFHVLLLFDKLLFNDYTEKIAYAQTIKKVLLDNWCRNIGSLRKPVYQPLCTYVEKFINNRWRRNFDVQYCNPALKTEGVADVVFYCIKYMLKPSDREERLQQALHLNLDPDEYQSVWNLVRCRSFYSTGFGLSPKSDGKSKIQDIIPNEKIDKYLRDCIERSKQANLPYPCFYHPVSGLSFPLSRYYCKRYLTLKDEYDFYFINSPDLEEPYYDRESLAYSELMAKLQKHSKNLENLSFSNDDYLEELCP